MCPTRDRALGQTVARPVPRPCAMLSRYSACACSAPGARAMDPSQPSWQKRAGAMGSDDVKTLPWTAQWIIAVLVLLATGFVVLRSLIIQMTTPSTPRPLFHEWELRDQGWKWAMEGVVTDSVGNWLFCDKTLNFLVLIATRDPSDSGGLDYYEPTYAVFNAKSRYETRVDAARDALLIVIPGNTRHTFRIDAGLAVSLFYELWNSGPDDCVPEVLSRYRGPDRQALKEFIEAHFDGSGRAADPE